MGKTATGRRDDHRTGSPGRIDPQQVIAALGPDRVAQAFADLGVEWNERKPHASSKGWKECHAIDRTDVEASAAVNVLSGYYTDRKPGRKAAHLFQFAMERQPEKFPRWIDAARHYAELAGLTPGRISPGKRGEIPEGDFDYRDESGTAVYRVFRKRLANGKKRFSQHAILPNGGIKLGEGAMDGVQPLPYGLPELLRARPEEPVFIVEGEGKVNRLWSVGKVATSAHGGCQSFAQTWARFKPEWFTGRPCILLPDQSNDGRAYMGLVAEWLRSAGAASVKVVDLPDLAQDQDIIQWLDQGGTASELDALSGEAAEWEGRQAGDDSASEAAASDPSQDRVVTTCFSDIVEVPILWLIPGKIPLGKVTLLAGEAKTGKSFVTMWISAAVSSGLVIPCSGGECMPEGDVLILSAEDDAADTIKPRLIAAGANTDRIHEMALRSPEGSPEPFTLSHLAELEEALGRLRNPKVVIIDPITAYIGGRIDDHKDAQLRTLIGPLKALAAKWGIALIVVGHFNKGNGTNALNKIKGSGAYTALARANWVVIKDPQDPRRRLLLSAGMNLAEDPTGLAFRIDPERRCVVWEDAPVLMTADEALRSHQEQQRDVGTRRDSKLEQCEAWLNDLISPGKEIPSTEILKTGEDKGFKRDTVFAAKKRLEIRAKRTGFGADGGWSWYREQSVGPPPTSDGTDGIDPLDNHPF